MRLANRTAIVTGGGSGIGRAITAALAREGATVVIAARGRDRLNETAQAIEGATSRPCVIPVVCDVRSKADCQAAARTALDRTGRIDILVNNTGVGVGDLVVDCPEESWDYVMDSSAKGTFLMSQAVLPAMIAQRDGFILNIGSQASKHGYARTGPYCAAKFAVLGFGLALQEEVREHGIRVHTLCPGIVQVPSPSDPSQINRDVLQVEDMAETALFVLTRPRHMKLEDIGLFGSGIR